VNVEGLLQVRTPLVNFHVLRDKDGLYLLDAGFAGAELALEKALLEAGWADERIVGIILTHGHLDHILNVGKLARKHGAWIAAPRLDADFYRGNPKYSGWARVGGWLEKMGRLMFNFEPFKPDRWIDDGDFIDVWEGLRAVHLPGHTAGHTGYFCEKLGLLFSADLFASHGRFTHFPPRIFNADPVSMRLSLGKALALNVTGIVPNHCGQGTTAHHLECLQYLARRAR
jgi:glyoxylase-like metal-dependent hydrolase (beta-lactamase superfamily II)